MNQIKHFGDSNFAIFKTIQSNQKLNYSIKFYDEKLDSVKTKGCCAVSIKFIADSPIHSCMDLGFYTVYFQKIN